MRKHLVFGKKTLIMLMLLLQEQNKIKGKPQSMQQTPTYKDLVVAPTYETKPWGFKEQDNFLNIAIRGNTSLSPTELFSFVKDIERKIGRIKRFKMML